MRTKTFVLLLVSLIAVQPVWSQEEREASFSISSNETYAPGQTPQVTVWAEGVHSLEFRLYRVNDPVKFFTQLKEQHNFGGRAPRVSREHTWLERFHEWKHAIYVSIRDFIRAQFTSDSRAQIRDWRLNRHVKSVMHGKVESYAQIPVLNRQQVVAVWQWTPESGRSRWESSTVPIPAKEAGVYLVEATNGTLRAYTVIVITELAVITKTASGQVVNFVVDRKTGAPIANASVLLWVDGADKGRVQTGADGLAAFNFSGSRPENVSVLVEDGTRFAVNTPGGWGLSTDEDREMHSYAYTDRPVYRLGDNVHFKFMVRTRSRAGYEVPKNRAVKIELHDAQGNTKLQKELKLSEMGSLSGDYQLPSDASLGYWYMSAESGSAHLGGASFYVEEYKKPEYQVRVNPTTPRVIQGQPITATIDARYYFGEPVANAKITWVVHRSGWWAPGRYVPDEDDNQSVTDGGEDGEEGEGGDYSYAGQQAQEQSGTLDADGKLTITIPTELNNQKYDDRYRIEARVTDAGNREISGVGSAYATYGSFYLDTTPDSYMYKKGNEAAFSIRARDYEGKPIQTPVRVEISRYDCRRGDSHDEVVWSSDAKTDANGESKVRYTIPDSGSFHLRVTATTPEKREVSSSTYIWVPGSEGYSWWGGEQREKLRIITDKKEYAPGDTAHIAVTMPTNASHVMIAVEGAYLYSYQVAKNAGGSVLIDVPIRNEYVPNVFVTATYIQNNKLYQGSKKLKVPAKQQTLDIQLQPSKPQFQPGESATYTLLARDFSGRPVRGEFTFGVVDEAIYAIRPETVPNITTDFYGSESDRVETQTSLTYYFSGEAGKRTMQLANLRPSRNLAQLKPERLVEPKVRKAFPDTAYWTADVKTDADGKAQIKFDFPDALTTWRATARGITADTKIGSAVEKVIVRKNLMVRLVVPRFFRQGDEITVSTIVHNYLSTAKTAHMQMEFDGLQVIDGATRDIEVPSRGEAKADWRVKVSTNDKVRVLGKALTNEESDAMELTLPAQPFGVKLSESKVGSIVGDGEQRDQIGFPASAQPGSRTLEITMSPSVAGTIFNALEFLTSYPYGCTEQTMSSFLPNVIVGKTLKDLGIKSNVDPATLNKQVAVGLNRLYDYQHDSGGWGWWKTDDDNPFMTAYVVTGLAQAKDAGFDVRDDVVQRGRQWLISQAESNGKLNPDLRAYIAYALAVSSTDASGAKQAIDNTWSDRSSMTPYGVAVLGLALEAVKDSRTDDVASMLEKQAKEDQQQVWWESQKDWLLDFWDDTSPEATAFAIKFLSHVRPQSSLLPKAAAYLVSHRNQGYWWSSTKQTAMVVFGLTDFVKASGELNASFSAQVYVGDKQVLSHAFTKADMVDNATIKFTDAQVGGSNNIRVVKSGAGRLYWTARAQYYSTDTKVTNTGSFKLSATREYFKLTSAKKGDRIVYQLNPMPDTLAVGDTIAVRVTVGGNDWRYLMIEDPIPAGTEPITKTDLYELDPQPKWWGWWWTEREIHDDRVTFFQTYFSSGSHEYVYLLKVVNPGVFRTSPTRVEPMYQPQFLATTEPRTVTVK